MSEILNTNRQTEAINHVPEVNLFIDSLEPITPMPETTQSKLGNVFLKAAERISSFAFNANEKLVAGVERREAAKKNG